MASRKDRNGIALQKGEYQRSDGKSYQYQYKDNNGSWVKISAKTLDELREKEKDIRRELLDGMSVSLQKKTLNHYYEIWKQIKTDIKPNVFSNYCYMYDSFVKNTLGKRPIVDIKKSDVKAFFTDLAKRKKNPLSVSTLDSIRSPLSEVFQLAVDDNVIRANPADKALKLLKRNSKKVKVHALTAPEQKRLLDFMENSKEYFKWYPLFAFMLDTGLRVGEFTGLRWEDIDLTENMVKVTHTLVYYPDENRKQKFSINTPKSESGEREIPLTDLARLSLGLQKAKKQVCKSTVDGYTNFIFLNRFGRVYQQAMLNKALKRIVKEANLEAEKAELKGEKITKLPDIHCHMLRHSFCVNLIEADIDIKTIQSLMGHADISTTMDIYAEVTKNRKAKAIKKLEFNR